MNGLPTLTSPGESAAYEDLSHLLSFLSTRHPDILDAPITDLSTALLTSNASINVLKGVAARDLERDALKDIEKNVQDTFQPAYESEGAKDETNWEIYLLEADLVVVSRMSSILDVMGVTREKLSKSGEASLDTLTSLAATLNLGDVSTSSYQCAMTDLLIEEQTADEDLKQQQQLLEMMTKRQHEAEQNCRRVETALLDLRSEEAVEKHRILEWRRNAHIMEQKAVEYTTKLEDLELSTSSDVDQYCYNTLMTLNSEIESMAEELDQKERTFQSFRDLPPDITLAKFKIAERKQELARLIEQKQDVLSSIAHGIS